MSDTNADLTSTPAGDGTSISASQFRTAFPAFADSQDYADGEIEMWLDLSDKVLPANRWGDYRNLGQMLFTAHNLTLNKRDEQTSSAGGVPGLTAGVVTSKSVGGASVSYDSSAGLDQNAGEWNLTTFGRRFWRLVQMAGMGGTQVGGPDFTDDPAFGMAWPGVIR